ncbi:hypothetical protein ACIBHX_18800 [Nonomuraea sp. NPDC050536]|uniref:hypothetical protein n=1 Tax=Nonomuraea sp. NPDC050536 TaxID=3364366 RepID=UPI0037CC9546
MNDPAEMMRIIEQQQAEAVRRLSPDPLLTYVPWGVAWLLGYAAFFLTYGFDGHGLAPIGWQLALTVLMGLQVVALIVMIFSIRRSTGRIRGESSRGWAMWGSTWMAGFFVVGFVDLRLGPMLTDAQMGQISTALAMLVVGILYMTGGALGREWPMFLLGCWVLLVDGVAVGFTPGVQALLLSLLAGGGTIVAGCLMRWRA